MPNLYPTMNLPSLVTPRSKSVEKKYYPAPNFDFEVGEFLIDAAGRHIMADGKEAWEQWCIKTCATERCSRMAYSDKIGTEMEYAMKEPNIDAVKSSIVRTITETLLVNPATEYVKNFSFKVEGDNLWVSFDVKGRNWLAESRLTVKY